MNIIQIEDLPFASKARITWGFLWRTLVIAVGSSICGGIIGGIAGLIIGLLGLPAGSAGITGGILGAIIGFYFLYLLLRWVLKSQIGNYKFVLTQAGNEI
jgi:membrane associated rhomboid family serine protease